MHDGINDTVKVTPARFRFRNNCIVPAMYTTKPSFLAPFNLTHRQSMLMGNLAINELKISLCFLAQNLSRQLAFYQDK